MEASVGGLSTITISDNGAALSTGGALDLALVFLLRCFDAVEVDVLDAVAGTVSP